MCHSHKIENIVQNTLQGWGSSFAVNYCLATSYIQSFCFSQQWWKANKEANKLNKNSSIETR